MIMLKNKLILVTGLASNRSIAYGIASQLSEHGARLILTFQNERLQERMLELIGNLNVVKILPCDVSQPAQVEYLKQIIEQEFDNRLDGLVHSIAYAPADQLQGSFIDQVTLEGFNTAHEVSSYSLCALAQALKQPLINTQGSIITLTYLGSERYIPHYNVMGLAKASLEAAVRYLAADLGQHQVRVNAISAGPIRTLAASGIKGLKEMLTHCAEQNLLKRNVDINEIGKVATFLLSSYASPITGEIIFADCGYSKSAMNF
ncbi:enoyl-ACP reductase [bacterium]|nr:enoyl-ACP reductase [bacterium]NBW56500.1 enoyl-ACP reductase [bacterium]NBX72082.1 enoyl-ACP reductase [bacterium]